VVVASVGSGMPVIAHSPIDDRARNVGEPDDRGICAVYLFTYEDFEEADDLGRSPQCGLLITNRFSPKLREWPRGETIGS
jgi:hypothetical protein